jgi:hypothetical protein
MNHFGLCFMQPVCEHDPPIAAMEAMGAFCLFNKDVTVSPKTGIEHVGLVEKVFAKLAIGDFRHSFGMGGGGFNFSFGGIVAHGSFRLTARTNIIADAM